MSSSQPSITRRLLNERVRLLRAKSFPFSFGLKMITYSRRLFNSHSFAKFTLSGFYLLFIYFYFLFFCWLLWWKSAEISFNSNMVWSKLLLCWGTWLLGIFSITRWPDGFATRKLQHLILAPRENCCTFWMNIPFSELWDEHAHAVDVACRGAVLFRLLFPVSSSMLYRLYSYCAVQ